MGGGQSLDGAALCGPCGPGKGAGVLRMGVLEGGSPGIPQQGPGWGTGRGEGTGEDLMDHEGSGLRQRGQPLCDGGSHGHQEGAILSAPEVEPQVSLGGGAVSSTTGTLSRQGWPCRVTFCWWGVGGVLPPWEGRITTSPSTAQDAEAQRGRGTSPSQLWQSGGPLPGGQPAPEAVRPWRAPEGLGGVPAPWVGQALGGQAVPGTAENGQGPGLWPHSSEKKEMPAFLCLPTQLSRDGGGLCL